MNAKRIIIAGGSGFIGRALSSALARRGDEVIILTRSPGRCDIDGVRAVHWDGRTIGPWAGVIDGADAVVNLAGKNVNCRYTPAALREIDQSRVDAVTVMGQAIARCSRRPGVLVQASTTAIYGDAGERWCDETTPPGEGIPVRTATQWESAFNATAADMLRTRRVLLRIGFVLGRDGGVMRMLSALTRCFLGGAVGSGRQYISWIHLDDLVRVFIRVIDDEAMTGRYVVGTPNPVASAEFMRRLRRALHRPWSPPVPVWAVRLGCFFMRTEPVLALTGRRCMPRHLIADGFEFRFPLLDEAMENLFSVSPVKSTQPSAR